MVAYSNETARDSDIVLEGGYLDSTVQLVFSTKSGQKINMLLSPSK